MSFPLIVATGLPACSGPLSALDPAGPAASGLALVWWVMFAASMAILAAVLAILTASFLNRGALRRVPERAWLWGGGIVFPVTVLAALLIWALPSGQAMLAGRGEALVVEAEAYQWGWTFHYPGGAPQQAEAASEAPTLFIPAGRPVDVVVRSRDVIHAFWIPRLAGKIDAIPGQTNVIRIEADTPGVYRGRCAEFCGIGHAGMNFTVIAYEEETE